MDIRGAVEACPMLAAADTATKAKIISCGLLRGYRSGELLFREREAVDRLYFVVEGHVALYRTSHNQERRILFICDKGMLLNDVILSDPVASISCVALQDVLCLTFSRQRFLDILREDSDFALQIIGSEALKIRRLYRQMSHAINSVRIEQQVTSRLFRLGDEHGEGYREESGEISCRIDFPMTVTFLADLVGAKRETVSRVVSRLKREGLLRTGSGFFYLLDLEGLKQIAKGERELP